MLFSVPKLRDSVICILSTKLGVFSKLFFTDFSSSINLEIEKEVDIYSFSFPFACLMSCAILH